MQKQTLIQILKDKLAAFPEIQLAYLFGSTVKDRMTAISDIDLAVAADRELDFKERMELQAALTSAVHRDVDLIDLNRVSGAILQQALCSGECLLNRSPALLSTVIQRMWYHQADMMPYVERMLRAHGIRYIYR